MLLSEYSVHYITICNRGRNVPIYTYKLLHFQIRFNVSSLHLFGRTNGIISISDTCRKPPFTKYLSTQANPSHYCVHVYSLPRNERYVWKSAAAFRLQVTASKFRYCVQKMRFGDLDLGWSPSLALTLFSAEKTHSN